MKWQLLLYIVYIVSIEVKNVSFTACAYSLSSYLNFYIIFILFKRKGNTLMIQK